MDRLSALSLVVALAACESKSAEHAPAGRVNAAKVEARKAASAEAFCDVFKPGETGPAFKVPALTGGELPAKAAGWRWINVWATWCKPCLEEMPRLAQWRDKLAAAGKPFELSFVSVDETDEVLAAFRTAHPNTPASPRLAKPDEQGTWFAALGLDGAPPIPIHIFVTPGGHMRCARAGGVREQDYAAIEAVFTP